jgi:hypothetical protein
MIHGDEETREGGGPAAAAGRAATSGKAAKKTSNVVHTYPTTYLKQ